MSDGATPGGTNCCRCGACVTGWTCIMCGHKSCASCVPITRASKAAPGPRKGSSNELSDRERQVVELLADGVRTSEIARRLFLSVKTVSTFSSRAQEKLHVQSRQDLITVVLAERQRKAAAP